MSHLKTICSVLLLSLLLAACGGAPSDNGGNEEPPPPPPPPPGDTTPPSAPQNVSGESDDQLVELTWSANSESDLAGYNLYRSESSFSSVSSMTPVNGGTFLSGTDYSDSELQNGTTYYYRLTAVDDNDNESGPSAEVEVTPFSDPPVRPKK